MALNTKYSNNCTGLNNNSNSLMFYETPGGGQVCPSLNILRWGRITKKPDGSSYNWGDADPTFYPDGFDWGHDAMPFIYPNPNPSFPDSYICTPGDWIDTGSPLTYTFTWYMSTDGNTWLPALGIISDTDFIGDTYKPILGIHSIKATVTVTSATCSTGVTANTTTYRII